MTFDELRALLQRLDDAITCAEIEREEARRLVLVPGPASAVKLEAWLAAHGLTDVITVQCSQFLPPDTWYVINERAMEADQNAAMQKLSREPMFPYTTNACCGLGVGQGHLPGCLIGNYAWTAATIRDPRAFIRIIGI